MVLHDLFDPIPGTPHTYGAVVGDPPWYPPFCRAFILRASELLQRDGLLLLSVPSWLTRPSAIADRLDILRFAMLAGFDLVEVAAGELAYQSPGFERAALSLQGLQCGEWRRGDLYSFRRVSDPAAGLVVPRPSDEPEWDEFRLGRRKLKLRRRSDTSRGSFAASPLGPGGALLSEVSRRSPVRARIDLWTSDNLAYSIQGMAILRTALSRLENGLVPAAVACELAATYELSTQGRTALERLLYELSASAIPQARADGSRLSS